MGKARRRTDTMDVIKHSQKLTKKAAGMKRQLASGTAFTHRSAMAATKTLGSSAGGGPTSGTGDLEMHTYDIRDVDRLYFAVTAGSSDRLESQATGIEAASYAIDVGGTLTQFTFGMNFQIPNDATTKPSYQFNIGSGASPVEIKLNVYDGADLIIRSNVDKKSCLRFEGIGYGVSSALPAAAIYFDGTDIMAKTEVRAINLTSGGLPYISNTINTPSDAVVDGWFNTANGSMGIQYYETSGQTRIWAKANDTWQKTYAT